jgi:hypothetical protein
MKSGKIQFQDGKIVQVAKKGEKVKSPADSPYDQDNLNKFSKLKTRDRLDTDVFADPAFHDIMSEEKNNDDLTMD